ncbi:MAG: tRNA pseudouridine(55) synthase TruB, partial [Actinomycetota bacterium]
RYRAVIRFGAVTTTQDASGEVLETHPVEVGSDEILRQLKLFVGAIRQIPPMVSAVRVGGERLHAKARRGEEVERSPRDVTIYELEPISLTMGDPTELEVDVLCSSGTYIRTLAHDLGRSLGCGAHLRSLRRTKAGGFSTDDAIGLDEISAELLCPLRTVVGHLPVTEVDDTDAAFVHNGRPLAAPDDIADGELTALVHDGELLAVYKRVGERIVAERVVPR